MSTTVKLSTQTINMPNNSSNSKASASAKPCVASRRVALMPAALQPDAILEAANYADVNASVTPQSVNHPITFAEFVAGSRAIDGSSSSATSEASPMATTAAEKDPLRNARRNLRVSTAAATTLSNTPTPTAVPASNPTTPTATTTTTPNTRTSQRQREQTEEANRTNSNLFVRNMSLDVDQAELDRVFGAYGTILSSAVMRNIHTGESLGTGFVRFSTHEEAVKAMSELNNCPIRSRAICIQWAKRHDSAPVGEARKKIMKLFVRNIPLDCTVEKLENLFSRYGYVRQVTLHKDTAPVEDPAMERLIAFVIFTEEGAAERAATAVHNTKPFASCNGIPVMIKLAEDQARHDRARNAHRSQPVSPQQHDHSPHDHQHPQQQQQQQQHMPSRFLAEYAEEVMDVAAFFEAMRAAPQSPSNGSEYNATRSGARSAGTGSAMALRSPLDYPTCNSAYIPPSALVPNTAALTSTRSSGVLLMGGRPCLSPTCVASTNDYVYAAQPVLCSPLTSPLSVNVAVSVGPASVHNSSFAGSTVGGVDCQRVAGQQRMATPTPHQPNRPHQQCQSAPQRASTSSSSGVSARSSPDSSVESGYGRRTGVVIPKTRSATLAAGFHSGRPGRDEGGAETRPPLSPCVSVDAASRSVSAAAVTGTMEGRGVRALQSPLKYRHNPYSLFASAIAC